MMSLLRNLTLRQIQRALECGCPNTVPRSGEAGAKVNCFSVYIDKATEPYLLVDQVKCGDLECREWNGERFADAKKIPFSDVRDQDLSVTHFYGCSEVQFRGFRSFVLGRLLRLPYVKIHITRAVESTNQYFFNKKKLVTKQRIELLRFLVDRRLDGRSIKSPVSLMTELYSIKWVLHPDKDSQHAKLRFYMESLVATEELKELPNGDYEVTGKALQAIESYEEQERKHTENVKTQRATVWLTAAIVLLTAAQADVIKFPTLLDLSKWGITPHCTGLPMSVGERER